MFSCDQQFPFSLFTNHTTTGCLDKSSFSLDFIQKFPFSMFKGFTPSLICESKF